MNDNAGRETLEDVLNAFVAAVETPSSDALAEWVQRYPQYERELADFVVAWSRVRRLPSAARSAAPDTFVARGMEMLQGAIREKAAEDMRPFREGQRIRGLADEARALNLTVQQLARRTGLSLALLRKLDRRLIRYASIPRQAIEVLAQAIGQEMSAVAEYLSQAPQLAASASHRAEQAPALAEQEDFFEAVQNDMQLSPEQQQRWMALRPINE